MSSPVEPDDLTFRIISASHFIRFIDPNHGQEQQITPSHETHHSLQSIIICSKNHRKRLSLRLIELLLPRVASVFSPFPFLLLLLIWYQADTQSLLFPDCSPCCTKTHTHTQNPLSLCSKERFFICSFLSPRSCCG